jgi:hypothetical protein
MPEIEKAWHIVYRKRQILPLVGRLCVEALRRDREEVADA